ncbi:MAG: AbrB/MazE/SpoVT family DNA-binding domain-containing protein [Terriglobales bacterium]
MRKAQVVKWGNSLAVRIPKGIAEEVRLREGDSIVIEASKGCIELRPTERVPTLEELVAQITPENRYEEIQTGREVGKEIVEW